jgi:hypothetical protein
MSRWNEREIARKLAESDPIEPPAGLLEKIKGEIPPTLPVGVPQGESRRTVAPPQRWLIAASLVAMIGAGFFALQLRKEPPRMAAETAPTSRMNLKVEPKRTGPPAEPGRQPAPSEQARRGATRDQALQAPPPASPALPKPQLSREEQKALKALGYAAPEERADGRMEQGVAGGVVGGAPGGAPAPPGARAPAPPPQAVAAPSAAKAEAKPEPEEDRITVTAESPLLDERRVSTGATVSQTELEKIPTAKEAPKKSAGRINAGGNESGRQSDYVGPGNPYADAAAHPVSTFRLDAGTGSGDVPAGYYDFDAFEEMQVQADVAITAEGAPTPFVHGPRFRLLRFHLGGVPKGTPVEVSFNPAVVGRYQLAGSSGLYEIELRPEAPAAGRVATVHVGERQGNGQDVALSAFAPSWEKASPGFRLAALAERFGEILNGAPATAANLDDIAHQVREIGKRLPASARATELADRVEKAAKLRRAKGGT